MKEIIHQKTIHSFTCLQGHVSIWRPSFPGIGILMLKIRLSWDRLIFNMGIPILVRRHLYMETDPWSFIFLYNKPHNTWTIWNKFQWNLNEIQHPCYWPFIRGIPLTKTSDAEIWCFLWSALEQTVEQTNKMPVIWDAITRIMTSL